jgi:hypothetical protein
LNTGRGFKFGSKHFHRKSRIVRIWGVSAVSTTIMNSGNTTEPSWGSTRSIIFFGSSRLHLQIEMYFEATHDVLLNLWKLFKFPQKRIRTENLRLSTKEFHQGRTPVVVNKKWLRSYGRTCTFELVATWGVQQLGSVGTPIANMKYQVRPEKTGRDL